jgi:CBS domain-containing protein
LSRAYEESPEIRSLHVTQWGQLVGMISPKDLRRVPEERWERARIGAAMTPLERLLTVDPEHTLLRAYRLMAHREVDHAPVVVQGRVVGMLSLETLRRLFASDRPQAAKEADERRRQRLSVAN